MDDCWNLLKIEFVTKKIVPWHKKWRGTRFFDLSRRISPRKRNRIEKYFRSWISGPGGVVW